jgi:hypothetical protein
VLTDQEGNPLGIGRAARNVPRWLRRQLLYRDHGCTFPGCGTRMFLRAHHIHHWELGGPTDYDNLVLVCAFHHKLVHEGGWSVCLNGTVSEWYKPSGRGYDRGPTRPANAGSRHDQMGSRLPLDSAILPYFSPSYPRHRNSHELGGL